MAVLPGTCSVAMISPKKPRAPGRERPPAPDPIEIGAGTCSRARLNLSFFRRSTSVFYRAHG